MTGPYDDIIALSHPVSIRHPRMPALNRAAQFAPFAALTGYDAALQETARKTDRKTEPDETVKAALDQKQQLLCHAAPEQPTVTVTCFIPDERKDGGAYITRSGRFRSIDPIRRLLLLTDGTAIPLDDILELESDLFRDIL